MPLPSGSKAVIRGARRQPAGSARRRLLEVVPELPEMELSELQTSFTQSQFHEHPDPNSAVVWGEWRSEAWESSQRSHHGRSLGTETPSWRGERQPEEGTPSRRPKQSRPRKGRASGRGSEQQSEAEALPQSYEHGHSRNTAPPEQPGGRGGQTSGAEQLLQSSEDGRSRNTAPPEQRSCHSGQQSRAEKLPPSSEDGRSRNTATPEQRSCRSEQQARAEKLPPSSEDGRSRNRALPEQRSCRSEQQSRAEKLPPSSEDGRSRNRAPPEQRSCRSEQQSRVEKLKLGTEDGRSRNKTALEQLDGRGEQQPGARKLPQSSEDGLSHNKTAPEPRSKQMLEAGELPLRSEHGHMRNTLAWQSGLMSEAGDWPHRQENGHTLDTVERLSQGIGDLAPIGTEVLAALAHMLPCYEQGYFDSVEAWQLLLDLARHAQLFLHHLECRCVDHSMQYCQGSPVVHPSGAMGAEFTEPSPWLPGMLPAYHGYVATSPVHAPGGCPQFTIAEFGEVEHVVSGHLGW